MSVSLMDHLLAVQLISLGGLVQNTWVRAETECTADILDAILLRHQMDNRMCGLRIQLNTVCIVEADYISGKLNDRKLHAETKTEEWNLMLTRILDCNDLTVDTAVTETARYQYAADIAEKLVYIALVQILGRDPLDIDIALRTRQH